MSKILRPTFLFLALGLGLACGLGEELENFSVEPVAPENPEYVGHWHSDTGVDLVISDNGMLNYENTSGGMSKTLEMPIQSWTETGFEEMLMSMGYDEVRFVPCLFGQTTFVVARRP